MAFFDVTKFTSTKAKPLPVILLLDESNSMSGDKIERLNEAVIRMLNSFRKEETQASEFLVSIIGFGGDLCLWLDPTRRSPQACKSPHRG